MRKLFTLAFSMLAIAVSGQIRTTEISSHYESQTGIVCYKIDESVTQDINGGYGFKLKTPSEFTSLALGWMSTSDDYEAGSYKIVFKVHKPGKGWSGWKTDEGFTNPDDTQSGFYKSDLLFGFDEFRHDSVEFYIHAPEGVVITDLYIIVMDISKTVNPDAVMLTDASSAKSCPEFPAIIPRSEWCGSYDECHNPTYTVTYRTPTHTVIHHGASPDSYTDGYAIVRSYWYYHVYSNGWSDIGYNYLFDKYGNFFQGRHNPNLPNQDVNGAHAGLANPYSIGLNFLGNSDAVNTAPTAAQLQKCSEFMAWWFDYKGFDPLSSASVINQLGNTVTLPRVCGHLDINPGGTTCPGATLYDLIPDLRTSTNQIIVDCTTPSDTEAPTTSISTDRDWYNSEFEVMFSDADNTGGTGVKYSLCQIMDYDGTEWRANGNEGYFNDNFTTAIHSDWTQSAGTWSINTGHLLQTNETNTNTNIYASVEQESGNVYLYHWQQKISGTGSNKRSGMHFFCSDPTQTGRENSYMVYLRADANTVQIYKYSGNSYDTADGGWYITEDYTIDPDIWYDVKVVLNTTTGVISLYIDNNFAAEVTDASPLTSGTAISLRTGECETEYDDIKVYRSRANTISVLPAESNTADIRYQSPSNTQEAGRIRTVLVDNAGNWSTNVSKNIFTDFDIPATDITVNGTWQTDDFAAGFTDTDALSGIEKGFYNVSGFNGSYWSSNLNRGFASADFDSYLSTEWTSQTGTWALSSGSLVQTDETEGNTNIFSYLQQDLSNRYLYEFDMKIEGSGSNKRAGFHYFCDDPALTNRGNGYFVWFRLSTQNLEFYKVTDDVFTLEKYYDININAAQWYNIKIMFDRITGVTLVYMDDALVGEYKDSEPFASGNNVSFRSGNSIMSVDNFKVYRSRYPDVTILAGSDNTDDIRQQNFSVSQPAAVISSVSCDSAKNISAVVTENINIDFTSPAAISTINDGSSADIDQTFILNSVSGNWTASSDANSGITAYYYAIGTTPGGTQLMDWTSNGNSLNFTNNSLSLIAGTTYYISVKAINGAGLYSDVATSDGLTALEINCPDNFSVCISDAAFTLSGATPAGGTYSGTGTVAGSFNPQTAGASTHTITYLLSGETCTFDITVNPLPEMSCPDDIYIAVDGLPVTLSGASPAGGYYSIDGNTVTSFDPQFYGTGNFLVTYNYEMTSPLCSNICTFTIYVFEPTVLSCPESFSVCADADEFALSGATPPGGVYSGTGVSSGIFNPAEANTGENLITYILDENTCYFTVTVNELPVTQCGNDIEVTTADPEFTLNGSSPEGGWYEINGIVVSGFNPQTYGAGTYTVTYFYESGTTGCLAFCEFSIIVTPYVSAINSVTSDYAVYPNPNNGNFTVEIYNSPDNSGLEISNIQGQVIYRKEIYAGDSRIEINNLSQGIYFVRIQSSHGYVVKKIVVKQD